MNARTWREAKQDAICDCCSRLKHGSGRWMWINQKVIVLSVTPERHIDHALLLFDDRSPSKEVEINRHSEMVEKSRKNSKLLQLLAPIHFSRTRNEEQLCTTGDYSSLTRREKEIMHLVSEGMSSKEIAVKLYISKNTVESHRKHILHKLSVKNAPQAVNLSVKSIR